MRTKTLFGKQLANRWLKRHVRRRNTALAATAVAVGGGALLAGLALYLVRRWTSAEPLSDDELREIEAFDQYERERVGRESSPSIE